MADALEEAVNTVLEGLGLELVEIETAGPRREPILRVRIDRPAADAATGVSIEDCTRASRALNQALEARPDLIAAYSLEVSSPGVERPLVRSRDFVRFAGSEIAVKGSAPLAGRGKRLTGVLLGISDGPDERIRLRLDDGEEVEIPRRDLSGAHLIFRWDGKGGRAG